MQTCFWQVAEIISSNVPVAHCSLSEESSFVGSVKKGRHRRSHRRTLLPEAMPIGVPSAAHRLAVLPMCQPLICHRALVTMSQSLDGAPSRLCRKPGRSAASVPPACPFPFPAQQPHARFRHPCSPAFPGEFPYPVLLLSANPSTPSRHIAGSCRAFPGRKKVVRRQKIRILFKVLPSRQFHSATPKPSAFIKTFFEKKASKSLPGRKKVIPLQPQTRSNGVIRPALRSEEEVIEKFTYQAASVRIQRKTNRQGLEEKDRRIKKTTKSLILAQDER